MADKIGTGTISISDLPDGNRRAATDSIRCGNVLTVDHVVIAPTPNARFACISVRSPAPALSEGNPMTLNELTVWRSIGNLHNGAERTPQRLRHFELEPLE